MDAIDKYMKDRFGADAKDDRIVRVYETCHARFLVEVSAVGGGTIYSFIASIPKEITK